MFAIICRSDGYPVSRSVGDNTRDLVVTWTSREKAQSFLAAKGLEAEYEVVALTEEALEKMAQALGCAADTIAFDAYPG
ncbi:MAG: hypothetical protein IT529_14960 [Burkholderiales bacterium]|nr:hypothetical protein [Burkholderiales bacterium]